MSSKIKPKKLSKNKPKKLSKNKPKKISKNKPKKLSKNNSNKHQVIKEVSEGCIINPNLTCSKKFDKKKYVSKLIDLSRFSKHEVNHIEIGIQINNYIKKFDPNHKFFLTLDDNCTIKNLDKSYNKIFDKCKIDKKNNVLNMVYKKGIDFKKNIKDLSNKDITKVLYYLVKGLSLSFKKINIMIFDINEKNLLFMKDEKTNKYYPVFIDFKPEHVFQKYPENIVKYFYYHSDYKIDLEDFSAQGMLYDAFLYFFTRTEQDEASEQNLANVHNLKYGFNKKEYAEIYIKYFNIIYDEIVALKKSSFIFIEKLLLSRLANSFSSNKNFGKNKFFKMLINPDITKLPTIDELSKLLRKELKIKGSDSLSKLHIKL
jgi:hypothetical protein